MTAPIEVFFWTTPNAWKITLALEEMGLPYTIRPVAIGKGEQFKPEFLAISPNNRVPAIIDHEGPGNKPISVFESGAILQYLGRKTGEFYPADERRRAEVDMWLFWQMAGVGPMFGQATHFKVYAPNLVDDAIKIEYSATRYSNEANRLLGVLDRRLADENFVAGDYSIADMALYPWVAMTGFFGQDVSAFPRVAAWLDRIAARPAVQRGMAAGAELRHPPPTSGSDEQREFARALFGQTAATVAEASLKKARVS
jgi:glutathione S-transferase